MKNVFLIILFIFTSLIAFASENSNGFTQADRDRLLKLEIRMEENMKTIEAKFEAMDDKFNAFQAQMNGMQNQINNLFNLVTALIVVILGSVGYSIYDRIKANAPIKESIEEVKAKNVRLTNLLKEFAEKNTEFKTIFDRAAIL